MNASDFYDGHRFDHAKLARCLIDQFHVCKIEQQLHVYRADGLYHAGADEIHGAIAQLLPDLTDSKRREVVRYLSVSWETPTRELATERYIPFIDKVYDRETDSFLDYSPDLPMLYKVPHRFVRDAER